MDSDDNQEWDKASPSGRKLFFRRIASTFHFPPAAKAIALICIAVFAVQTAASHVPFPVSEIHDIPLGNILTYAFGLYWPWLAQGAFWQPVTYAFLHGSLLHLFFNLFTLLFFGSTVEYFLGSRRFWWVFLGTSVLGGLGWMLFDAYESQIWAAIGALPWDFCLRLYQHWGENQTAGQVHNLAVGASAGVCGLIGVFTALFPRERLTLLVFGIIPVRMQTRFLAILLVLVSIGGTIYASGHIAHMSHLAGGLAGYLYARIAPYPSGIRRRMKDEGRRTKDEG